MARCNCRQYGFRRYHGQFVCKRCGRVYNTRPMGFFERLLHHHKWNAISRNDPNTVRCKKCGEIFVLPDLDDMIEPDDLPDSFW